MTSPLRNPARQLLHSSLLVLGTLIGGAVGHVALAGAEESAARQAAPKARPEVETAATETAAAETPTAKAAPPAGSEVYRAVCIACHAPPGIGGAPALGDGDAWAARIAQGTDTLIDHALNGFSGSTGIMPRKGGRIDLSDEEIIAAVEYMVEQVSD